MLIGMRRQRGVHRVNFLSPAVIFDESLVIEVEQVESLAVAEVGTLLVRMGVRTIAFNTVIGMACRGL